MPTSVSLLETKLNVTWNQCWANVWMNIQSHPDGLLIYLCQSWLILAEHTMIQYLSWQLGNSQGSSGVPAVLLKSWRAGITGNSNFQSPAVLDIQIRLQMGSTRLQELRVLQWGFKTSAGSQKGKKHRACQLLCIGSEDWTQFPCICVHYAKTDFMGLAREFKMALFLYAREKRWNTWLMENLRSLALLLQFSFSFSFLSFPLDPFSFSPVSGEEMILLELSSMI